MHTIYLFLSAGILSACLLWLTTMPARALRDPLKSLSKIRIRRQSTLLGVFEAYNKDADSALYERLGRARGVWQIGKDANTLRNICWGMELDRIDAVEYSLIINRAFGVNLSVYLAMLESLLCALSPQIPRHHTRHVAAEYLKMCAKVQSLAEVHAPFLIDQLSITL